MGLSSLLGFASTPVTANAAGKRASLSSNHSESSSDSSRTSASASSSSRGPSKTDPASMLTPATSTYNPISDTLDGVAASPIIPSSVPGLKIPKTKRTASKTSYATNFTSEPIVTYPYTPAIALSDLPGVGYALELFLSSKMHESEAYCQARDPAMERLYFATGNGLIQCVKGLMSYEDVDLLAGIAHTKQGNHVASQHRKKTTAFLGSRLAGYVVSSVSSALHAGSTVAFIKSMTDVERHAELVYAESLFEKALLGIVYSGDWLAFVKEALNMRTTIGIYRNLHSYIEAMDAAAVESGLGPIDPSIDVHFRSGVYLGVGLSNLILSMMPGKLAALVELFGYKGDRKLGLDMLMKSGGWSDPVDPTDEDEEPKVAAAQEGVRRTICDMSLLIFHLVLSSFTFEGVDVHIASRILKWNLKRYPDGVFFLFGAGRLGLVHSQPRLAIHYYTKAMEVQTQYRNLHHISFWEIAIARLALWELEESLECWRGLEKEATWSKAIYTYGMAVCLLESAGADDKTELAEAAKLMERVPGLRQKIAGKSIPMEKFVARKARKFTGQGGRLALPALEMAYLFQGITHAPRTVIIHKMLPEVDKSLRALGVYDEVVEAESRGSAKAKKTTEKEWQTREKTYYEMVGGNGTGYWDDYALVMFLRGVCMRYVAYPDPDAELDPNEVIADIIPQADAARAAELAFRAVFEYGPKIELDHHLVYHAHYELGRLLSNLPLSSLPPSSPSSSSSLSSPKHGPAETAALEQFELILSGKHLEVGPSGKKGKYSMENALAMRTHAAVDVLGHGGRL